MHTITTLDNGLQVVTEPVNDVSSVAMSFWVGTGSRDENESEGGMSHFLEHLLFKGSETRSSIDINQAIDGAGGDMNAFTTKECTAFYLRVLHDDVELAMDILCDIICEPALDPVEVDNERRVVLEEILMYKDEPADIAHERFAATMFGDHGLGREILGPEENIETMKAPDIRTFFEHHYRPQNLVFSAAGRLTHDQILEGVSRRWKGRDGGRRPKRGAPSVTTGVRTPVTKPTDQMHMVSGVPAPNRHHPDRYVVSVLDVILGGGMSSRLYQEIREKRGLAYNVYSGYSPYDDVGELSVYLGTAPSRVDEAEEIVRAEFSRMREHGVTDEELSRAKRHLRATTLLNLEDTTARMSRIGRSLLMFGEVLQVDEVSARINSVTRDDIARLAEEVLSVDPVVVTVGPEQLSSGELSLEDKSSEDK